MYNHHILSPSSLSGCFLMCVSYFRPFLFFFFPFLFFAFLPLPFLYRSKAEGELLYALFVALLREGGGGGDRERGREGGKGGRDGGMNELFVSMFFFYIPRGFYLHFFYFIFFCFLQTRVYHVNHE
jgi:hypothetical protein